MSLFQLYCFWGAGVDLGGDFPTWSEIWLSKNQEYACSNLVPWIMFLEKIHPWSNPWYLWMWPYWEIRCLKMKLSWGHPDEIILDLEWLRPYKYSYKRRDREIRYRDTRKRPHEDKDGDWSYAATGWGTLGATGSWTKPWRIPHGRLWCKWVPLTPWFQTSRLKRENKLLLF